MQLKTFKDTELALIDYSPHLAGCMAYFTTTKGGVSAGAYQSLNLSKANGDDAENVDKNTEIVMSHLPKKARWLYGKQVHGVNIFVDDGAKNGLVGEYDGVITKHTDVILSTFHADCIPVFASVEGSPYIGVAHSGWSGTYGEIAVNLVMALSWLSGRAASDIHVVIGAGIDGEHYEVGADLAEDFARKFGDDVVIKRDDSYYLDLKRSIQYSLLNVGILKEHIFIDDTSTYLEEDLLFSYRRQGAASGRMMTAVMRE